MKWNIQRILGTVLAHSGCRQRPFAFPRNVILAGLERGTNLPYQLTRGIGVHENWKSAEVERQGILFQARMASFCQDGSSKPYCFQLLNGRL